MTKCSFDPTADIYKDAPIGMFHCPECDLQDYMLEYLKDNLPNNLGWSIYLELDW